MPSQLPSERAFLPPNAWVESYDRRGQSSSAVTLASGRLGLIAVWMLKGWDLTNVMVVAGSTGAVAPTNQWCALYDPDLQLIAVTADLGATAWAANTFQTFAFPAGTVVLRSGVHYVGVVVVAATAPALRVGNNFTAAGGLAPALAMDGDAGLTTPATAPALATPATLRAPGYLYVT